MRNISDKDVEKIKTNVL